MNRRFWFIVLMSHDGGYSSVFDVFRFSDVAPIGMDVRQHVIVQALKPMLRIAPPYGSWFEEQGLVPTRLRDLARIEITLYDEHGIFVSENNLSDDDRIGLSDQLTSLLAEALQLGKLADLPEASGHSDREIRSVADHPVPDDHPDRWTILVTLARDAFVALQKCDRLAARALFERWIVLARRPGFGVFLRLALFAATQVEDLSPDELVRALLDSDRAALWSSEIEAELAAFLRKRGPNLETSGLLDELLAAIRMGPPEAPCNG